MLEQRTLKKATKTTYGFKLDFTIDFPHPVFGSENQVNEAGGRNHQSLINEALKGYVKQQGLERTLRRLIREELRRVA